MKRLIVIAISLIMVTSLLIQSCDRPKSPAVVTELKCEFQENPVGIDRDQPLLQWKIEDDRRGAMQTAFRIIVSGTNDKADHSKGDVWDSGKIISDKSVHVAYEGPALESGKTYYWRVRVWDKDGKSTRWSDPAFWETGLLDKNDWQAEWIARSSEEPGRSVYMRSDFDLDDKEVKRARAYVSGLGNYVLYINGTRVGDDLLTPGWTDYPKRLEYQVYDVKDLLNKGANAAGAILGNMWWSGGLGWQGGQKYSEGPLQFICQLMVEFNDGSVKTMVTDRTWKWTNSPVWDDNIYHGEKYDANLEIPGWNRSGFDDSSWADVEPAGYEGKFVGPGAPAMKCHMEIKPVALNEPVRGEYVYDLGQNMVGWAKVKVNVPKGDTVKLRFAELLHDDGTVAQENLRSATATDMIVSNGEEIVWEPKFTYHGFRYVQISGLKSMPSKDDLTGKVIYTDQPLIGKFESSNELINTINKNILWGQKGNFYPAPTDCPQRDERLGWMGDAQIFAPTANFNMHLDRYWTKWMFDITDGQDEEGWVYDVNPHIVVGGPSKPGWGDAVVVIPWMTWRYFGDIRILEENYEGMKAWVEYMRSKSENDIYVWKEGREDWFGYGDWIAVDPTPSKPIGTAYYCYSAKLLGKMAEVLGKADDARNYAELAEKIASAYQREYWDPDSLNYPGGTQTASLLPLAFGMVPDDLISKVVQNLVDNVKEKDVHPTTGFLGTGFILPMLSKYNYHDLAYEMINKTDYPSWGYMVKQGATTIWELWNSDTEPPDRMNSRNHFALGCIGEWIWNTLAGVNICDEKPGFKRIIIRPEPVGDLKWVKARYETNYGMVTVDWKAEGGVFTLNLTVPPNSDALVMLPGIEQDSVIKESGVDIDSQNIEGLSRNEDGSLLVTAGNYLFTVE
ncbi:MAG: glycoside hydrolase family 78 protein [Prolixibacteraceae bacterium]|nr:glycoside hydrolase family 78 protein [Prolixibacteraceae bacterium]